MKALNRVVVTERSSHRMRLVLAISSMLILTSGCWLSREWDSCLNDRDCPNGQICWRNERTRVCIPPEYVDLGEPDGVDDTVDSGEDDVAEDVADLVDDPSDISDEIQIDTSEDLVLDQAEDQPTDPESEIEVGASDDPLTDIPNEDAPEEPDASNPPRLTLRGASITTSSGSILSVGRYRLTRHGIEQHERVCAGQFCVTGGITP